MPEPGQWVRLQLLQVDSGYGQIVHCNCRGSKEVKNSETPLLSFFLFFIGNSGNDPPKVVYTIQIKSCFMIDEKKLITSEFTYFVGAMQGDGSYGTYVNSVNKKFRTCLMISAVDREMVEKCARTFNRLKITFSDPPNPPNWIIANPKLFGAYIAGLIDSDGNVCIKRKKYPQCRVKIISGSPQENLRNAIEKNLNCKVSLENVGRIVEEWGGRWYPGFNLVFLISKKNWYVTRNNILPFISIPRKRAIIEIYLKKFEN